VSWHGKPRLQAATSEAQYAGPRAMDELEEEADEADGDEADAREGEDP
jgi:hypothetical protein